MIYSIMGSRILAPDVNGQGLAVFRENDQSVSDKKGLKLQCGVDCKDGEGTGGGGGVVPFDK